MHLPIPLFSLLPSPLTQGSISAACAGTAEDRRGSGFYELGFEFHRRGILWQGRCHTELQLPEYEIARITTGQFSAEDDPSAVDDGANKLPTSAAWNVEIPPTPYRLDAIGERGARRTKWRTACQSAISAGTHLAADAGA